MMDEIDEFFASLPEGRCKHCEFSKCVVANDQWMFLGCWHEPSNCKWIPMSEQYKNKQSNCKKMPRPEPYTESNGWTTTEEMSGWIKDENK